MSDPRSEKDAHLGVFIVKEIKAQYQGAVFNALNFLCTQSKRFVGACDGKHLCVIWGLITHGGGQSGRVRTCFGTLPHNAYYFCWRCLMRFVPPHTVNMNRDDRLTAKHLSALILCMHSSLQIKGFIHLWKKLTLILWKCSFWSASTCSFIAREISCWSTKHFRHSWINADVMICHSFIIL